VPYRRVSAGEERRTRLATLIPISLFGFAVGAVVMGLAVGIPRSSPSASCCSCCRAPGFVVVPLLVLSRATRDEG
jgi:hypothetical protein